MTLQTLARRSGIVATVVLVAACGNATSTGTPGAATTPVGPSDFPAATFALPSISPGFSITLPSEDKALEDLLPDDVGGEAITKASMAGTSLVGNSTSDLSKVLIQLGKTPADISAAFGNGGGVSLAAYRLKGVDATALLAAFVTMLSGDAAPTITDANVGGKPVKQVVSSAMTVYVYPKGDVLFTATRSATGTDAAVVEAVSKLP